MINTSRSAVGDRRYRQRRFWDLLDMAAASRDGYTSVYRGRPAAAAAAALAPLRDGHTVDCLRVLADLLRDERGYWDTVTALWLLAERVRVTRTREAIRPAAPPVSAAADYIKQITTVVPVADSGRLVKLIEHRGLHPRALAVMLVDRALDQDKFGFRRFAEWRSDDMPAAGRIAVVRYQFLVLVEYVLILAANLGPRTGPVEPDPDQVGRVIAVLDPPTPVPPFLPLFSTQWANPAALPPEARRRIRPAERSKLLPRAFRITRAGDRALQHWAAGRIAAGVNVLLEGLIRSQGGNITDDLNAAMLYTVRGAGFLRRRVPPALPLTIDQDTGDYLDITLAGIPAENTTQIKRLGVHPRLWAIEYYGAAAARDGTRLAGMVRRLLFTDMRPDDGGGDTAVFTKVDLTEPGYPQVRCLILALIELGFLIAAHSHHDVRTSDHDVRTVLEALDLHAYFHCQYHRGHS